MLDQKVKELLEKSARATITVEEEQLLDRWSALFDHGEDIHLSEKEIETEDMESGQS